MTDPGPLLPPHRGASASAPAPQPAALVELGLALRARGYEFVTPTPETHRRVNSRLANAEAKTLRDVFGWSRPFAQDILPEEVFALCARAGILESISAELGRRWRSRVRFSTVVPLGGGPLMMFVHSAFPTDEEDAVFFGPDSYRFAALLARTIASADRLVDIGCGSGVGGLLLAPRAKQVILADVNPRALEFAAVNATLAGCGESATVVVQASDVLGQVDGKFDAVIANPPYLVDVEGGERLYRNGGGPFGLELAERIVAESLDRLSPGGTLVLYTGTPVVDGRAVLLTRVGAALRERASTWSFEELDPDVFGEELTRAAYQETDRLAVVALTATRA